MRGSIVSIIFKKNLNALLSLPEVGVKRQRASGSSIAGKLNVEADPGICQKTKGLVMQETMTWNFVVIDFTPGHTA